MSTPAGNTANSGKERTPLPALTGPQSVQESDKRTPAVLLAANPKNS